MTKNKDSRKLWGLLLLAVGLGATWESFPMPDASADLARIPRRGAFFTSREIPLTEAESARLGEASGLKLIFSMRGRSFFLTVLDGTRNRNAVHDPLYCFRGRGAVLDHMEDIEVEGGRVRWLTMHEDGHVKNALFWYSDGERRFASVLEYWARTTLRRLTLGASGQEPVALMILPSEGSELDRDLLIQEFLPLIGR